MNRGISTNKSISKKGTCHSGKRIRKLLVTNYPKSSISKDCTK